MRLRSSSASKPEPLRYPLLPKVVEESMAEFIVSIGSKEADGMPSLERATAVLAADPQSRSGV